MGCTHGHYTTDRTCRVFRVHNVDDQGNKLIPGKLEVSDIDLILYQTGKEAIRWPLRCLRRYGFDADLFSFESGRRCPTGQGIYAFCCRNAEDLFNLVQESIKDEQNRANHNFISATSISRLPTSRPTSHIESYETPTNTTPRLNINNSHTALPTEESPYVNALAGTDNPIESDDHNYINTDVGGAESVKDPVLVDFLEQPDDDIKDDDIPHSLQGLDIEMDDLNLNLMGYSQVSNIRPIAAIVTTPTTPTSHDKPNNPDDTIDSPQHNKSCSPQLNKNTSPQLNKSHSPKSNKSSSPHRNKNSPNSGNNPPVIMKSKIPSLATNKKSKSRSNGHVLVVDDSGSSHNYANVPLQPDPSKSPVANKRPVQMNYIQLELTSGTENGVTSNGFVTSPSPTSPIGFMPLPESPTRNSVGYAQIDFNKTNALQMSNCNKNMDDSDDGVRKTRHNSTINDM